MNMPCDNSLRRSSATIDLNQLSCKFIFPVLVVAAICNQPRHFPIVTTLGLLASTLSIVLVAVILLKSFPHRAWAQILIGLIIFFRLLRLFEPTLSVLEIVYQLLTSIAFCICGAWICISKPRLLRNQFSLFMLLSLPLMVVQLLGITEWAHVLRTDFHSDLDQSLEMQSVFMRTSADTVITTLQTRPAGFLHANNFLAVFIIGTLVLRLACSLPKKLDLYDYALLGVITIAMSKTVFLAFTLMAIMMLIIGNGTQRKHIIQMSAGLALCLAAYSQLFPGLVEYTMSFENANLNFDYRLADLLSAVGSPATNTAARDIVSGASQPIDLESLGGTQSSYSMFATLPKELLLFLTLLGVSYIFLLRLSIRRTPQLRMLLILANIGLAIVLVQSSFLGSSVFAFIFSPVLLPIAQIFLTQFALRMQPNFEPHVLHTPQFARSKVFHR